MKIGQDEGKFAVVVNDIFTEDEIIKRDTIVKPLRMDDFLQRTNVLGPICPMQPCDFVPLDVFRGKVPRIDAVITLASVIFKINAGDPAHLYPDCLRQLEKLFGAWMSFPGVGKIREVAAGDLANFLVYRRRTDGVNALKHIGEAVLTIAACVEEGLSQAG